MRPRRGSRPGLLWAVLPIAILLLALGLRLYRIDTQSLWNDEGTSVAVASRDLVTITRDAAGDIHPPLYSWLLAGWQRLAGTSECSVRSLAALLCVAVGPAVLAYRCWGLGVQRAGPAIAGFFSNLTPLFAALMSAAFLGEMPRTYHALAFALIVGGIVVSSRR